jgi:hypothetical protein
LPRVELMEKTRSRLEAPRAVIERGRSNPLLAIAAIMGALLLIAWIAWAIYVTNDNGANAGLGVVVGWPALLAALAVVASPFVGLYLLLRYLRAGDEAGEGPAISGASADADPETEEKPAAESEDEEESGEDEESEEDEESDEGEEPDGDVAEEERESDEAEAGEADEDDEPEETDPDEEPPSGGKAEVTG